MTAPVIGITAVLVGRDRQNPSALAPLHYVHAVRRAGATPMIVPVGELDGVLDAVDGLVFPGGRDFDTRRLGLGPLDAHADPAPAEQQDWNVALAMAALDADVPVLGICSGMQLLALVGGGALIQHLPAGWPGRIEHRGPDAEMDGLVEHDVAVEPGSAIACALTAAKASVLSSHHQAIASVGSGWQVTARDADGLIEGIERPDRRFALGVQWHPERSAPGSMDDGLFRALAAASAASRIAE